MLTVPCSLYYIWVLISADALELEWYTGKPRMYDETHKNLDCCLYAHGSLFGLLYLTSNISRCIQKLEWCIRKPRMYDETHQIQITECDLYTVFGSLFALLQFLVLHLCVNISRGIHKLTESEC